MKANALLKWLVPAALLAVVMIILKTWVAGSSAPAPESSVDQGNLQLSAEQAKSLGIAGDTPRDTVATLVGQVKAMRSDMLGLKNTTIRCRRRTTAFASGKTVLIRVSRRRLAA